MSVLEIYRNPHGQFYAETFRRGQRYRFHGQNIKYVYKIRLYTKLSINRNECIVARWSSHKNPDCTPDNFPVSVTALRDNGNGLLR